MGNKFYESLKKQEKIYKKLNKTFYFPFEQSKALQTAMKLDPAFLVLQQEKSRNIFLDSFSAINKSPFSEAFRAANDPSSIEAKMLKTINALNANHLSVPDIVYPQLNSLIHSFKIQNSFFDDLLEWEVEAETEIEQENSTKTNKLSDSIANRKLTFEQLAAIINIIFSILIMAQTQYNEIQNGIQLERHHNESMKQDERQHHELMEQDERQHQELIEQNERHHQELLNELRAQREATLSFIQFIDSVAPQSSST